MAYVSRDEVHALVGQGRVARSSSVTFGQTAAGCHSATSAERLVRSLTELPVSVNVVTGEGRGYYRIDDKFFNGSNEMFRILPHPGAPLRGAETTLDKHNLAYQRSLLGR